MARKLWEYEEEVRLLLYKSLIIKNPVCIDKNEIGEIVFGLKTPQELEQKVIDIIKTYPNGGANVKLFKCIEVPGKYAISKTPMQLM